MLCSCLCYLAYSCVDGTLTGSSAHLIQQFSFQACKWNKGDRHPSQRKLILFYPWAMWWFSQGKGDLCKNCHDYCMFPPFLNIIFTSTVYLLRVEQILVIGHLSCLPITWAKVSTQRRNASYFHGLRHRQGLGGLHNGTSLLWVLVSKDILNLC